MDAAGELKANVEKLHTTPLGVMRIKKNLSLCTDDVVAWCKNRIVSGTGNTIRKGKNYYVSDESCTITIHAHSYTIITAHRNREKTI